MHLISSAKLLIPLIGNCICKEKVAFKYTLILVHVVSYRLADRAAVSLGFFCPRCEPNVLMYNLARPSCCVEIIGLQLHLHIGAETLSGILQMTYRKNRDLYMVKGSNMIVCVFLVSNSRGCCLAAPGDHEGAALLEAWIYIEFSNDIWVKWF